MLTHGNVVAAVSAVLVQLSHYRPNVGDVMISYLPLAHMLERCCEVSESTFGPPTRNYFNNVDDILPTERHVSGWRCCWFLQREH